MSEIAPLTSGIARELRLDALVTFRVVRTALDQFLDGRSIPEPDFIEVLASNLSREAEMERVARRADALVAS